tara:strand:- start:261 stop:479 length:219 start_codon:yes stop_codon:yes gene_type:complete
METTDINTTDQGSVNLVDRVRKAIAGIPYPPKKEVESKNKAKIDGRTKEYRAVVKRIEARRAKQELSKNDSE